MNYMNYRSEQPVSYCRCSECRFKYTHTTSYHKCGTCGLNGHGQLEHGHTDYIQKLSQLSEHDYLKPELWCKSPNCSKKTTHTDTSHICELCGEYHIQTLCSKYKITQSTDIKPFIIECPLCMAKNEVDDSTKPIFGISEKCNICATNEISFILPTCNHCCMCLSCSEQLKTANPLYQPTTSS